MDWLNPIFVLKTRRWFVSLRKYGPFLLGFYLLMLCCSWRFFSIHETYEIRYNLESFAIVEYFIVGFFCFASCTSSVAYLPKRYIDEDLIHFTPLSDKQVLFGYFYIGVFYSGLACLCGAAIHLLLLPGLGIKGLIPLTYFFSFFLIVQMLNLFQASFFAGVRKQHEFILMGLSMYVTLVMLVVGFASHWYNLDHLIESLSGDIFLYWKCIALYVPAISACAYGMILWNLKRNVFLPWKMFRTGLAYGILSAILSGIRFFV